MFCSYAFIRYDNESTCKKEHDQAQGKTLNGRTIVTLFAKVLSNRKQKSELVSKSAKAKQEVAADVKGLHELNYYFFICKL